MAPISGPVPVERPWYGLIGLECVASPALLLYGERIEKNLAEMIRIAGGPQRLRPHVKTHKLPQLIQRQMELGIVRFKAATLMECSMAAQAGAGDILLAYPPVGPSVQEWVELVQSFPGTRFSCLADDIGTLKALSAAAIARNLSLEVLIDLDVGLHRTGLPPGNDAERLYSELIALPGLLPGGLHAYDGHITNQNPDERAARCDEAFVPVSALRSALTSRGWAVPRLVVGGSPTFPIHVRRGDVELSPGTTVLWDAGYAQKFPDLPFLPAAVLLTRVISKPSPDRLCLDLGHKAVASEMPHPRVEFLNLPGASPILHSEEHLVVECPDAHRWNVGDAVYAIPRHICPTVALHEQVTVVDSGEVTERWTVTARNRWWKDSQDR